MSAPSAASSVVPSGVPVMAARFDAMLRLSRHGLTGVALRSAAIAAAAVAVALVHRVHDPGVLCPTRALTGIPCPLCGGTTVFIELGSGRPLAAVAANPVAFTGAVSVALAPLGLGGRWWALSARTRTWLLGAAIIGSEFWQLARFGLLRS